MLSAFLLALSLAACDLMPISLPGQASSPTQPGAVTLSKAQQLEEQGDFAGAAQAYITLADAASPPLKHAYRLNAVSSLLRAGEVQRARELLNAVPATNLDVQLGARRQVLDGEIALSEGNAQQALGALEKLPPSISPSVKAQAHVLRAEAYSVLGNQIETARERVLLEPLLTDPVAVRDNQSAIVQALSQLSDQTLQQLGATPPDILSGWMELVLIARTTPDRAEFERRVTDWRHRYRQHPAMQELIAALPAQRGAFTPSPLASQPLAPLMTPTPMITSATPGVYPQRIALLVPLSGTLAGVGAAVRDGFLAAAAAQPSKPEIRVYDVAAIGSGAEANKALQVYQQAVQEGAEFVVGPLEKEGVKALYTLGALPVPTLALNYSEESAAPPNLYQFGLLPEDEARQVAERAWFDGHNRALVLVPQGDWGDRMLSAFSRQLEERGGIVVDVQTYAPEQVDFAAPVRKLLQYKGDKQRRQDADHIFIAAFPRQARGIRPQLHFFFASDLPTYATSHIYTGKPDPAADQDLDGILFADMPWVLNDVTSQQSLRQTLAGRHGGAFNQFKRLYALGVDAYHVIPHLERLRNSPGERFEGETGGLSVDQDNRIHRQLLWARFAGGVARPIDGAQGAPVDAAQ
ncbi:MAG: penicillin-binding protein activator [Pseudomonadota bacterium]